MRPMTRTPVRSQYTRAMEDQSSPPTTKAAPETPKAAPPEKQFHGWRLIGIILVVMVALAVIAGAVDWWVIGPLEGRAPWLK